MMLLQVQTQWTDSVSISTLPHPISMFLLGFGLFAMIFLFLEFKKLREKFLEVKRENEKLKERLDKSVSDYDVKLAEISKKVDSRVDKAILAITKTSHK